MQCGTACAYNNYTFNAAGGLVPMVHGTPSASGGIESGGDGAYIKYGTFRSELEMKDVFARFSLDLGENANWYVQGSWAQAENASDWIQWVVSPNNGRPPQHAVRQQSVLDSGDAGAAGSEHRLRNSRRNRLALPAGRAADLAANRQHAATAAERAHFLRPALHRTSSTGYPSMAARAGRTGCIARWATKAVECGDGRHRRGGRFHLGSVLQPQHQRADSVTNPNNTDNAKYLASLDAVSDAGTIKCWVTTQPQFASSLSRLRSVEHHRSPGGISAASYDYLRVKTSWNLTQDLDNVGASIGGGLWGFGLPAGEITANLSVDARWATYVMESDFLPSDFVNCTGLRMCLAAGNAAPLRWVQNTVAPVDVDNHVYEGALELNVPLLKDVPGFQDLSTNLAYRYTKYSSFDAVDSWKVGLNWQVVDSLRFRSTYSSDIRAPNLNDLFQPSGVTSTQLQRPAHGRQRPRHAARLAWQSAPDAGRGEDGSPSDSF